MGVENGMVWRIGSWRDGGMSGIVGVNVVMCNRVSVMVTM